MKQALHIFKKDVRYLRWELGVTLLLLALFVYMQLSRSLLSGDRAVAISYLQLAFWAFLCARLVQAEPIPGDRQFWITRPYDRRSLLGAKLIFIVVCIAVPLIVADAVILRVEGFSVAAHLTGLAWSLLLIVASALMVFCAFATLTRGVTEWMLAAIITTVTLLVLDAIAGLSFRGGVEWMREYGAAAIVFVAALVVLLGQYSRRRTLTYAAVMAVGLLASSIYAHYVSGTVELELETRFAKPKVDPSPVRLVFQKPPERQAPRLDQYNPPKLGVIALAFPIAVLGLREGETLKTDGVRTAIQSESGEIWNWSPPYGSGRLEHTPEGYRLRIYWDRAALEKTKNRKVQIRMTLYLTMMRDLPPRVLLPGTGAEDISGVGRCRYDVDTAANWILCESPLRVPSNSLAVQFTGRSEMFLDTDSYSPFPADPDSSLLPVGRVYHSGSPDFAPATLTSLEPVAHFRRDLTLSGVSLADYEILR